MSRKVELCISWGRMGLQVEGGGEGFGGRGVGGGGEGELNSIIISSI